MKSEETKSLIAFSVSHTTRKPRPGEDNGKDYHFISREDMQKGIATGLFLEHAEFSGNIYGTSKTSVGDCQMSGKICVLDIDSQGVRSLKNTDLDPYYVFIHPPNMLVLEARLRGRRTESEESLNRRLETAKAEVEFGETPGNFHNTIVNENLEQAVESLKEVILGLAGVK